MPVVNPVSKELVFKVVYYGPGLGGKTTTLRFLHRRTPAQRRGELVSVATPVDRTLFFDFLPIELDPVGDLKVRLQLFTVPGQVHYNATRKLVLTGADGVVLVADSQRARSDANEESLENLADNLREHGRQLSAVPHALCYNKRDLTDILSVEELERRLNPFKAPSFATVATSGEGVWEALNALTRAVLEDFRRRAPEPASGPQQFVAPEPGIERALGADLADPPRRPPVVAVHGAGGAPRSSDVTEFAFRARGGRPAPTLSTGSRGFLSHAHALDPDEKVEDPPTSQLGPVVPSVPVVPLPVGPPAKIDEGDPSQSTSPPATTRIPPSMAMSSAHGVPTIVPKAPARPGQLSFSELWSDADSDTAIAVEQAILDHAPAPAITHCGRLVQEALLRTRQAVDGADAPPDASVSLLLLGLDVQKYLGFRALVRRAVEGEELTLHEALEAYAFAIAVRVAQGKRQP